MFTASRTIQSAYGFRERHWDAEREIYVVCRGDPDKSTHKAADKWLAVEYVLANAIRHCNSGSEEVPDWDITKYDDDDDEY